MTKNIKPTEQSKLIGEHPASGIFFDWLECEDTPSTNEKKHRKLTNKGIARNSIVSHLSNLIIKHHATPARIAKIEKKKNILERHNFISYMKGKIPVPIVNTKTQKGNLGEIILAEYLSSSTGLDLLVYKLHYNPNVEQSMKGDDILLFDKTDIQSKVIMGEAKFRAKSNKQALDNIVRSLSKKNLPISLTFISDRLEEMGKSDLAEEIDELISKLHNSKTLITYTGFYYSDIDAHKVIEKHLKSDNQNLVVVSYSEENPAQLVTDCFNEAIKIIME